MDLQKLRAATEDDVINALDHSYVGDALHGVAPVVLLEFWQNMLDLLAGPRGEDD